ncbi:MAG: copper chaperone PCu(A)C [Erythrobacter sp.]
MITLPRAGFAAAASALLLPLAACSKGSEAPAQPAESGAPAASALTVSNARLVLAPVAGNPAAVYFDLAYTGPAGVSLTSVDVEGAGMTMIHDYAEEAGKMQMVMADSVPLSATAPVTFAPGGLHVMAMDPGSGLKPGATAKVTLTLSDGTKVAAEAPVRAAGDER